MKPFGRKHPFTSRETARTHFYLYFFSFFFLTVNDVIVHVVSTVHALTIVTLAAPLLWNDNLTQNKIFGYEFYAGQVYAVCCG